MILWRKLEWHSFLQLQIRKIKGKNVCGYLLLGGKVLQLWLPLSFGFCQDFLPLFNTVNKCLCLLHHYPSSLSHLLLGSVEETPPVRITAMETDSEDPKFPDARSTDTRICQCRAPGYKTNRPRWLIFQIGIGMVSLFLFFKLHMIVPLLLFCR